MCFLEPLLFFYIGIEFAKNYFNKLGFKAHSKGVAANFRKTSCQKVNFVARELINTRESRSSSTALSDESVSADRSSLMLDLGEMVTYKEFSRKLAGLCGIVEGIVRDQPDCVWVRWVGETSTKKENVSELEVL